MVQTISNKHYAAAIASFMGWPKPVPGMKVYYNRQYCNSSAGPLTIKRVDFVNKTIEFEQEMAYEKYELSFFDGIVFCPEEYMSSPRHFPAANYVGDEYLQSEVAKKILNLPLADYRKKEDEIATIQKKVKDIYLINDLESRFKKLGAIVILLNETIQLEKP